MNLNYGAATSVATSGGFETGVVPVGKAERLSKDRAAAWQQCIERLHRIKITVDAARAKAEQTGEKADAAYAKSVGHGIVVILGEMEQIARSIPRSLTKAERKFFVELGFDASKDTGDPHHPPTYMRFFPALWGLVVKPKNDKHLLQLPPTYAGHLNLAPDGTRMYF